MSAAEMFSAAAESGLLRGRGRARDLAARLLARAPQATLCGGRSRSLRAAERNFGAEVSRVLREAGARAESAARALAALNPENILRRGFSVARDAKRRPRFLGLGATASGRPGDASIRPRRR